MAQSGFGTGEILVNGLMHGRTQRPSAYLRGVNRLSKRLTAYGRERSGKMDRLTYRDAQGAANLHWWPENNRPEILQNAFERLAVIEDTGLTPDEIAALRAKAESVLEQSEAIEGKYAGVANGWDELCAEVEQYRADIQAGRLVRFEVQPEDEYDGLKVKYRVFRAKDGTPVENCFVLQPEKDDAALAALSAYAGHTENETLKADIFSWIIAILKSMEARAALGKV